MKSQKAGVVLKGKDRMIIRSTYALDRLSELAAETGMTKTAVLEDAIRQISERLGIVEAITTDTLAVKRP